MSKSIYVSGEEISFVKLGILLENPIMVTVHDAAFYSIVEELRLFTLASYTTGSGILERTNIALLFYLC